MTIPGTGRRSFYGKTRAEAAARLTAALRSVQQGLPIPGERQTVAQYLAHWLELKRAKLRPSTLTSYEDVARRYLLPEIGAVKLAALGPDHLDRMLAGLEARGLSARTRQYAHAIVRGMLNHAVRRGAVARNVATLVDAPRLSHRDPTVLDQDQAAALLRAARGDRLEALYTVALALGLRQGEALGLRWQDVDLDGRTLRVRHELQRVRRRAGEPRRPELAEPKSKTSRRSLPLPDMVVAALRAQRERQALEREVAGARWREGGFVFTTTVGTPLDPRDVVRRFKATLAAAGLPDMTFHELRHSCASLLLALGVPLRVVMEQLGHSQIAVTANLYTSVLPAVHRDAADRMDALLARHADADEGADGDGGATGHRGDR